MALLTVSIEGALLDIYNIFYPYEMESGHSIENRFTLATNSTFKWLICLGIVPDLITKPTAYYIL